MAIEFQELNRWRLLEFQPEAVTDHAQAVVEMREMIDSHVADEGAANFIVARAAMQPSQENKKLNQRCEADNNPIRIHGRGWSEDFSCFYERCGCSYRRSPGRNIAAGQVATGIRFLSKAKDSGVRAYSL
jgi:hypothetical protein